MDQNAQEEPQKELTLDDLARMVQEGFAQTASKQELQTLRDDVTTLRQDVTILRRDMDAGFLDLKHELKTLNEKAPDLEADVADHELRIKALERHTGLAK
jgi:hypothetical protein